MNTIPQTVPIAFVVFGLGLVVFHRPLARLYLKIMESWWWKYPEVRSIVDLDKHSRRARAGLILVGLSWILCGVSFWFMA